MSHRLTRTGLACALVLTSTAWTERATAVELLTDGRYVEHHFGSSSTTYTPDEPFQQYWYGGSGDTLQDSHFFGSPGVDSMGAFHELALWSAEGFAGDYGGGETVFEFLFSVSEPQPVRLEFDLEYFGGAGYMEFETALYRDGALVLGRDGRFDPSGLPTNSWGGHVEQVVHCGVLDPGVYRFVHAVYGLGDPGPEGEGAQAYANGGMTLVPEPAAGLLLATGLAGLALRGRATRRGRAA